MEFSEKGNIFFIWLTFMSCLRLRLLVIFKDKLFFISAFVRHNLNIVGGRVDKWTCGRVDVVMLRKSKQFITPTTLPALCANRF